VYKNHLQMQDFQKKGSTGIPAEAPSPY